MIGSFFIFFFLLRGRGCCGIRRECDDLFCCLFVIIVLAFWGWGGGGGYGEDEGFFNLFF